MHPSDCHQSGESFEFPLWVVDPDEIDPQFYPEMILTLVNAEREKVGASPLELDDTLTRAAMIRAQECTTLYEHDRPNGTAWDTVLAEVGLDPTKYGGNINKFLLPCTPEEVVNSWMESPGHRRTMLNPAYSRMGVGFARGHWAATYWVQDFSSSQTSFSIYKARLLIYGAISLKKTKGAASMKKNILNPLTSNYKQYKIQI